MKCGGRLSYIFLLYNLLLYTGLTMAIVTLLKVNQHGIGNMVVEWGGDGNDNGNE